MVKTGKPAKQENMGVWICWVLCFRGIRYLPEDKFADSYKEHAIVFQEVIDRKDDVTVIDPDATRQAHPLFKKNGKPFAALSMSKRAREAIEKECVDFYNERNKSKGRATSVESFLKKLKDLGIAVKTEGADTAFETDILKWQDRIYRAEKGTKGSNADYKEKYLEEVPAFYTDFGMPGLSAPETVPNSPGAEEVNGAEAAAEGSSSPETRCNSPSISSGMPKDKTESSAASDLDADAILKYRGLYLDSSDCDGDEIPDLVKNACYAHYDIPSFIDYDADAYETDLSAAQFPGDQSLTAHVLAAYAPAAEAGLAEMCGNPVAEHEDPEDVILTEEEVQEFLADVSDLFDGANCKRKFVPAADESSHKRKKAA